jgi:hypothetical protein
MSVTLEHVERIDASAYAVWPFFRWDNLEVMLAGGFFVAVEYRERRPLAGAIRVVTLADGARLVERLDSEDAVGRRLAYSLLDTGGASIADYRGEVVVTASGPNVCFVKFSSICSPVGLTAEEWRNTWTGMQTANAEFIRARTADVDRSA